MPTLAQVEAREFALANRQGRIRAGNAVEKPREMAIETSPSGRVTSKVIGGEHAPSQGRVGPNTLDIRIRESHKAHGHAHAEIMVEASSAIPIRTNFPR